MFWRPAVSGGVAARPSPAAPNQRAAEAECSAASAIIGVQHVFPGGEGSGSRAACPACP